MFDERNTPEIFREHMESDEYQERLIRDIELTNRIKAGYTQAEPTDENPNPKIDDGILDDDACVALSELSEVYQPLMRKLSNKEYRKAKRSSPMIAKDDLEQEAFCGLFRASLAWNPEKANGSFTSYARRSIWGNVRRYVDEVKGSVRVPAPMRTKINKARNTYWSIYSEEEHLPMRERLATALGTSIEGVVDIMQVEALTDQMGSIDQGYFEDDRDQHSTYGKGEGRWRPIDPSASEMQAVEEEVMIGEIKRVVNSVLDGVREEELTDREVKVIQMRFLRPDNERLTLGEMSRVLGVTRERVRQIESKALAKLRHPRVRGNLEALLQ
ncbi:sigma-70 family RNA polymerase sigma factor [Candidatus Saccharibacteria bacterium]|nr:sigma-70 family RNA polymerase sigma factor [Candidatus Saccharibacteria bacterium]